MNKSYDIATLSQNIRAETSNGSSEKTQKEKLKYKTTTMMKSIYGKQSDVIESNEHQQMKPFRNWDTIEKEKETQYSKDGILTYLKKIGLIPQKYNDDTIDFEGTFKDIMDEKKNQIE